MKKQNFNIYGININNERMLCEEYDPNVNLDEMFKAIIHFTASSIIDKMYYIAKGYDVTRKKDKFIITYKDRKYEFYKASNLIVNGKLEEYLLLNNYYQRMGRCHEQSIVYIDLADNLVTGYVDSVNKNQRIIHSWLEKDDYVLDFSHNLLINKKDYYELVNAKVLNIIKNEEFHLDFENSRIKEYITSVKLYCLFREELVKEYNDKILKLQK